MNAFHYGIYALTSVSVFLSFLVFIIYSRNNFNRGLIYKGISILLFTLSFRFFYHSSLFKSLNYRIPALLIAK